MTMDVELAYFESAQRPKLLVSKVLDDNVTSVVYLMKIMLRYDFGIFIITSLRSFCIRTVIDNRFRHNIAIVR